MRSILITGSNRGIGLYLVRQYLEADDTVIFATCRNPDNADALQTLAAQTNNRIHILPLDVKDESAIQTTRMVVEQHVDRLDVLINNAGILPGGVDAREKNISILGLLEADAILDVFFVNTVSPVLVTQAFAELLRRGHEPRVINVSSDAGSISRRSAGRDYGYAASKAALNMMTRCLAGDLHDAGVTVISIHPGFIKTDMGGVNALLTLDEAIPSMVRVIDGLTLADTGRFFNWDGNQVEW